MTSKGGGDATVYVCAVLFPIGSDTGRSAVPSPGGGSRTYGSQLLHLAWLACRAKHIRWRIRQALTPDPLDQGIPLRHLQLDRHLLVAPLIEPLPIRAAR